MDAQGLVSNRGRSSFRDIRLPGSLALFLLANAVMNLVLTAYQETTVLDFTRKYLTGRLPSGGDSWSPMAMALDYLHTIGGSGLYQRVFFEDKIKFIYAPTSLLFLAPVKALHPTNLLGVMNAVAWLAVGLSAIFLYAILRHSATTIVHPEHLSGQKSALLLLTALTSTFTFYPIVKSWDLGQAQTFINLLAMVGLFAYIRGRNSISGIAIGLSCLLKPQFTLFVLWAFLRRDWRFLIGLTTVIGLGLTFSVMSYGLPNHVEYLRVLSFISQHGEAFYPNQSINGLLNRALFNGDSLNWSPNIYPPYNHYVYVGTMISSAILVGSALFVTARRSIAELGAAPLDFSIAMLCFTAASPIAWEHHYGVLLPFYAVTLLLAVRLKRSIALPALGCLAISYLLTSNFLQVTLSVGRSSFNLLLSYLLFGALLLLGCMVVIRHNITRETFDVRRGSGDTDD